MFGNFEKKIYFNVYKGKIAQRVDGNAEGCVERTLDSGKTIHEIYHDYVEGYIHDMEYKEHEWNGKKIKSINFTIVNNGLTGVLSIPYNSRMSGSFYVRMENIDFSKLVRFAPVIGNNDNVYLWIQNGGENVEPLYTKDNPNGLPQLKKVVVNGEETWDSTEQMKFFNDKIKNIILPAIEEAKKGTEIETLGNADLDQAEETIVEETDDLPF
jgi:hypothetical protein